MSLWPTLMFTRRNAARPVIDLDPLYTEVVTPERLVEMYETEKDNIESVEIVPGNLGGDDFGAFVIRRKRPIYTPIPLDPVFSR